MKPKQGYLVSVFLIVWIKFCAFYFHKINLNIFSFQAFLCIIIDIFNRNLLAIIKHTSYNKTKLKSSFNF